MTTEEHEKQIARMEEELNLLESTLQRKYTDIGKSILELAESEKNEVNRLVEQIIDTKQKLSNVKGEIPCDGCMARNAPDSQFCKRCGKPLPTKNDKENDNEYNKKRQFR